jgi:hypothetical protein
MPYPEEREAPNYGPMEKVSMAVDVAVNRPYDMSRMKAPVLWRGMVTMFVTGQPFMDIEVTLLTSKNGAGELPYVAWPQRDYETQSGEKKYKNVIWCQSPEFAVATAKAIRAFMDDDRPF